MTLSPGRETEIRRKLSGPYDAWSRSAWCDAADELLAALDAARTDGDKLAEAVEDIIAVRDDCGTVTVDYRQWLDLDEALAGWRGQR